MQINIVASKSIHYKTEQPIFASWEFIDDGRNFKILEMP